MLKKLDSSKILLFLLSLTVAVVPLIVMGEYLKRPEAEVALLGSYDYRIEIFSYYKSKVLIVFSVLIALVSLNSLADALIKGRSIDFKGFIKKPQNIALCIYLLFLVMSVMFSQYKAVSLGGSTDRYEGFYVTLGYCLIFYTAMSQVKTIRNANALVYGVMFSAFIIGIVGVLQLVGKDPFAIKWFQDIIMSKVMANPNIASIEGFAPAYSKTVYATLYNPNNAGMYGAMLSMLTISMAILLPVKSVLKYVAAALTPFTIVTLVGSSSLGGMVAAAAGIVAFIFIVIVYVVKRASALEVHKKRLLLVPLCVIAGVLAVSFVAVIQTPAVKDKIATYTATVKENINDKDYPLYNYIHIDGGIIEINTAKGIVYISHDSQSSETALLDSNRNVIVPTSEAIDKETGDVTRSYNVPKMGMVTVELYDNIVTFEYVGFFLFGIMDGSFTALTRMGQPFDINVHIPAVGFENMQTFANARGHIWSRSIALIPKHIFIGNGPDTFVFAYPQHDLVGKANAFRDTFAVVDKAHNMYLQYAVNTGLISLLAMFAIFITYLITTVKSLVSKGSECSPYTAALRISIFASVCAYLVAGLATDSVVSVAPVFWCLLGLGFAVNNISDKTIRRV